MLGEKFAALVKEILLSVQPLEYVLPSTRGPQWVRQGLACFRLSRKGQRTPPKMLTPLQPLLQVAGHEALVVDVFTDELPVVLARLAAPRFAELLVRQPSRSPSSTAAASRVRFELLLPGGCSELALEVFLREVKRQAIGQLGFVGRRSLYTDPDA